MLKTPKILFRNPVLDVLGGGIQPQVLEEGVIQITHFSLDMMVWDRNAPEWYMGDPQFTNEGPSSSGVCDSPAQFLERFRETLKADERTFCMSFTHIAKDPTNKGQGGGWRWRKWGAYIGTREPQYEYLDDEDGFEDGVYVFHILQTDGPEKHFVWTSGELRDGPPRGVA